MFLIIVLVIVGILFFGKLFYGSFLLEEKIYLCLFEISSVELLLYFFVFLTISLFLIFKNNKNIFIAKAKILKLFIVHLLGTVFLLYVGAYTLSIVLQFVFLLSLIHGKEIFICIYFLCIHYSLLLLFGSSSFILYFLLLFASTVFIMREMIFINKYGVVICVALGVSLPYLYINMESFLYEIYIWLDVTEDINYPSGAVIYGLSFIHVAIFVGTIIKNQKNVVFKID